MVLFIRMFLLERDVFFFSGLQESKIDERVRSVLKEISNIYLIINNRKNF